MSITIEGNRPVEILDGLRSIGVLKGWSILDNTRTKFEVIFKTPQPTFSVGMRVEYIDESAGFFTKGMVYRITDENNEYFLILADNGRTADFPKQDISAYFTPYEKPKEGANYYIIVYSADIRVETWENTKGDNQHWNLGLAFAGKNAKEQATFARERLSKLF